MIVTTSKRFTRTRSSSSLAAVHLFKGLPPRLLEAIGGSGAAVCGLPDQKTLLERAHVGRQLSAPAWDAGICRTYEYWWLIEPLNLRSENA